MAGFRPHQLVYVSDVEHDQRCLVVCLVVRLNIEHLQHSELFELSVFKGFYDISDGVLYKCGPTHNIG